MGAIYDAILGKVRSADEGSEGNANDVKYKGEQYGNNHARKSDHNVSL